MKAIQVSQVGGPEVLTLVDFPVPVPKPNEAVVQVRPKILMSCAHEAIWCYSAGRAAQYLRSTL